MNVCYQDSTCLLEDLVMKLSSCSCVVKALHLCFRYFFLSLPLQSLSSLSIPSSSSPPQSHGIFLLFHFISLISLSFLNLHLQYHQLLIIQISFFFIWSSFSTFCKDHVYMHKISFFCADSNKVNIPSKLFTWLMKMNIPLIFLFTYSYTYSD